MKKTLLLVLVLSAFVLSNVTAQISEGGQPLSFTYPSITDDIDEVILNPSDLNTVYAEDEMSASKGTALPYRIAVCVSAGLTPDNAGTWEELPGGEGRIWRLKINSPGAKALSLFFDNYYIPSGAKMFVYDAAKKYIIGAFTAENNPESRFFATEAIPGESLIVEYFQPWDVLEMPQISLSDIGHFYRGADAIIPQSKLSGACEVNINCTEGANWQDEKKGVVRIQIKNGGNVFLCSGSLMNNTKQDCSPYILTADHCAYYSSYASTADMNQWVFYFHYAASTCNGTTSSGHKTMTGCTLKAHDTYGSANNGSDFYLVRLNSNIPSGHTPYYNGWNKASTASTSGVGIHHPEGDIMKISTYSSSLVSIYVGFPNSHWQVTWVATTNGHGVTEQGSSGSPLFNSSGQVVGTLTGGSSYCSAPNDPDYYGKFLCHWSSNGSTNTKQVKPWLDPLNTNPSSLNGTYTCTPSAIADKTVSDIAFSLYPNPASDHIKISFGETLSDKYSIQILNLVGDVISVYPIEDGSESIVIDVRELPSGIYFVTLNGMSTEVSRKFSIVR